MISKHTTQGFTLIELLTVMGVMATMMGVLGLALRDGSPTVSLQSAQGTVAALLAAARGEAALTQSRVILVVDADPAGEAFLRRIRIAIETSPASGQWRVAGDGAVLPRGVYVVPAGEGVTGATFPTRGPSAVGWPPGRTSSLEVAVSGSVLAVAGEPVGAFLCFTTPITAAGLAAGGGDRLVVAAARRATDGVIFDQPERVCGVILSSYGVATMVNDGPGFDF